MKNVYNDPTLKGKLTFAGDIVSYFKTSKATIESLNKNASAPIINEAAKKSIRFSLKLDQTSDHVITGVRLRLDHYKSSSNTIVLKVFNRQIKLKTLGSPLWLDIPFCDAEIMFGSFQSIDMELSTEDLRQAPIKLFSFEVFAQSRKDFQIRDKIKKLEKSTKSNLQKTSSNES